MGTLNTPTDWLRTGYVVGAVLAAYLIYTSYTTLSMAAKDRRRRRAYDALTKAE